MGRRMAWVKYCIILVSCFVRARRRVYVSCSHVYYSWQSAGYRP